MQTLTLDHHHSRLDQSCRQGSPVWYQTLQIATLEMQIATLEMQIATLEMQISTLSLNADLTADLNA